MANIHPELAERIRHLRHRAGLTQARLASESGISRIAISMIETGRQSVSPGMMDRLAHALGVSPQVLTNQIRSRLERERLEPLRQRLTLDISPDFDEALKDLSKQKSTSRSELVRSALQSYLENIGYKSYFAHEDVSGLRLTRQIRIRSVKQVMFHSNLLIRTFEEALEYDTQRHHNQPPPPLRLEDNEYLEELPRLVAELKQMNSFLANLSASKTTKDSPPTLLGKHLDIFLKKYSATLGYGAGVMTLGLIATLLYQLGAGEAVFDHVLKRIPD